MERVDLYWKGSGSINEEIRVIHSYKTDGQNRI